MYTIASFICPSFILAAKLLKHVLDTAAKDATIVEAYLHVHVVNDDARQFYLAHGFEQTDIIRDYYKRIEPPDSFVFKKSLKEGYVVSASIATEGTTSGNDMD